MSASPFFVVCLLFFALIACCGLLARKRGDHLELGFTMFAMFMTAWAAALLITPSTTT